MGADWGGELRRVSGVSGFQRVVLGGRLISLLAGREKPRSAGRRDLREIQQLC